MSENNHKNQSLLVFFKLYSYVVFVIFFCKTSAPDILYPCSSAKGFIDSTLMKSTSFITRRFFDRLSIFFYTKEVFFVEMRKALFCSQTIRYYGGVRSFTEKIHRRLPLSDQEYQTRKSLKPVQPVAPRVLRVAVVGDPNAGKSTIVNKLSGWRVCSVSTKVHTTRYNTNVVFVEDDKQVIFVDTPGVVTLHQGKKHHLEASLITHPKESLAAADVALVVVDASNRWTHHRLSQHLVDLLQEHHSNMQALLVLNKIDALSNRHQLLDLTRVLTANTVSQQHVGKEKARPRAPLTLDQMFRETEKNQSSDADVGWPHFRRVFAVSALTGEGIGDLRSHLLGSCKPGPWEFHPSMITDLNPQDLVMFVVREKLLDNLPKEMPYLLQLSVEMWDVDPQLGSLKIAVGILCRKKSVMTQILGKGGKNVKAVASGARQELSNAFCCDVALKMLVRSKDPD